MTKTSMDCIEKMLKEPYENEEDIDDEAHMLNEAR